MASIIKILRVLADPNRLRILLLLGSEELSVAELQEILVRTRKTIISVTHDPREAACLGDRVFVIDDLIATGGTLLAAAKLFRGLHGEVVGVGAIPMSIARPPAALMPRNAARASISPDGRVSLPTTILPLPEAHVCRNAMRAPEPLATATIPQKLLETPVAKMDVARTFLASVGLAR